MAAIRLPCQTVGMTTRTRSIGEHGPTLAWPLTMAMMLALGGCAHLHDGSGQPGSTAATTQANVAPAPGAPTAGMQYLYGSGEAAAVSMQAWRALVGYVATQVAQRPVASVILDEDATLATPVFVPCEGKPLAAVFDVDETSLLNLGFEANEAAHPGRAYDPARWHRYELSGSRAVSPVPGAVEALAALRAMDVTPVFNTNRSAINAAATETALNSAGLGPAVHKKNLWLQGDDNTGALKDVRRWWIADKFCVVAMAGDQLGDFSDLFDAGLPPSARRAAAVSPGIARLWGAGWFALPNPVYGAGLKGGMDEVFPPAKRWRDPGPAR